MHITDFWINIISGSHMFSGCQWVLRVCRNRHRLSEWGYLCQSAGKLQVGVWEHTEIVTVGPRVSVCKEALVEYVGTASQNWATYAHLQGSCSWVCRKRGQNGATSVNLQGSFRWVGWNRDCWNRATWANLCQSARSFRWVWELGHLFQSAEKFQVSRKR